MLLLYPYEVESLLCSASPYLLQNRFVLKTYKRVVHFYRRPVAPERPNVFFFFHFFFHSSVIYHRYIIWVLRADTYYHRTPQQYHFRSYADDVLSRVGRRKSFRNCDDTRDAAAVRPTAAEVAFLFARCGLRRRSAPIRSSSTHDVVRESSSRPIFSSLLPLPFVFAVVIMAVVVAGERRWRRNGGVIFTRRGIKYYHLHHQQSLYIPLRYRSRAPIPYTYLPIYTCAVCAVNDLLLLLLYSRSVGQSCASIL